MTIAWGLVLLLVGDRPFWARRDLLLGFLNIVTIIFLFGFLAAALNYFTGVFHWDSAFVDTTGAKLTQRMQFLYMSWTNLTTLGNSYTAATWYAQLLVMVQLASGLFLTVVVIALLVSEVWRKTPS